MSIGSDLLRFSDRPVLILDMETQRVNAMEDNLPFQVSWLVVDRWGKTLNKHDYYLGWPADDYCARMSADAARITRFQRSWVESGIDPEFVLDAFESYLLDPQYIVVGQNLMSFDLMVWQLWREVLGRKRDYSVFSRVVDTHLLSRAYKESWKPDRGNLHAWQRKVMAGFRKGVKTGLTTMAKELGVEIDETKTHGAAYDLELTLGVYRKLINLVEI